MIGHKYFLASIPIAVLVLLAVQPTTTASAYGKANWQTTFAGTFISPGQGGGGFWGWCAFYGETSGDDADCQVSLYQHAVHSQDNTITCEVSIDATGWHIDSSPQLGGAPGFFIDSGQITVHPASKTQACLDANFAGQTSSDGTILTRMDFGLPATPGHYNLNQFVGHPAELQETIVHVY